MDLIDDAKRTLEKLFEIVEFLNEDGDLNDASYDRVFDALDIVDSELRKV